MSVVPPGDRTPTERATGEGLRPRGTLLVIATDGVHKHPLPDDGELIIGRGDDADIVVRDAEVSRRHALLRLAAQPTIEDLGSANGVRVRGVRIAPGTPVAIRVDELVELGQVMISLRHVAAPETRVRQMWTHDYFEARLAEECARAERARCEFVLWHLHCDPGSPTARVPETFASHLRGGDVCGLYAPGEYEILLPETSPQQAATPISRIVDALLREQITFSTGIAVYPVDGRSPAALAEKATATAVGLSANQRVDPVPSLDTAMRDIYRLAERIAAGTLSVVITGETGVGKEVLAEHVHRSSPRRKAPFLRLNCAALSATLLESELFGHERGAFTGAVQAKPGLLETADGGTVFLDEIGELPATTQVKLLRVLEQREVQRVGGLKPRAIDVRFVAATHRDLEAEIAAGRFREDLYFRLNGVSLHIPPLRERAAEIEGLARAFLSAACKELGRSRPPAITPAALALLRNYGWPGNIRELRNVVQRAVLLCGARIDVEHLPAQRMTATFAVSPAPAAATSLASAAPISHTSARAAMRALERRRIIEALERNAGNQTRTARDLGISLRTLVSRLATYELPRPRKRGPAHSKKS